MPYPVGIVIDNTRNYEIVKTESLFGFGPPTRENLINDSLNIESRLEWISEQMPNEKRALQDPISSTFINVPQEKSRAKIKNRIVKRKQKKQRRIGKMKNRILKMLRRKRRKTRRKQYLVQRKYLVPFILGFLTAKSLLIPVALKILAFISTKGLMLGFFSTALASLLSLKGMFDHSHGYQNRKDDAKTKLEIIHVPARNEDHIYNDEHYNIGNYVPTMY